jgi:hypothetical protein
LPPPNIYNMPGLSSAKPAYWQEQIQPFFDSFAERDLSSTVERGERRSLDRPEAGRVVRADDADDTER